MRENWSGRQTRRICSGGRRLEPFSEGTRPRVPLNAAHGESGLPVHPKRGLERLLGCCGVLGNRHRSDSVQGKRVAGLPRSGGYEIVPVTTEHPAARSQMGRWRANAAGEGVMRRRSPCVISWRVAGRCACGERFGGSPTGPLAHLAGHEEPARLPVCGTCCPVCESSPTSLNTFPDDARASHGKWFVKPLTGSPVQDCIPRAIFGQEGPAR